ncbi:hypothetical protein WJX73_008135 [Symbiochloris irregularis]|uniref:Uncharacterized protein n=1 Tax=Symbiochloris irregularis TaxID=706552 RepID=A0AAW1PZT5_9CHLO
MVTTRGGGVTGPGIMTKVKAKIPGTKEHKMLKGTGGVKKHIPGTAEHNITHPTAGTGTGMTGGTGTTGTGSTAANVKSHVPGTAEHAATHPTAGANGMGGRPRKVGMMTKIKKAIPGTRENKLAKGTAAPVAGGRAI